MSLKRRRRQKARRMQELRQVQHNEESKMENAELSKVEQQFEKEQSAVIETTKLTTGQAIVDKLAGGRVMTKDEIAEAVMVDVGCTRDAVRRALSRLVSSGKVTTVPAALESPEAYRLFDATKDVVEASV